MKKQYGGFNATSAIIILVSLILVFVIVGIIIKVYQNYKEANPDSVTTDYGVDQLKMMNDTTLNCPDYWNIKEYSNSEVTCEPINDYNVGTLGSEPITLPTLTTEKWGDIISESVRKKSFDNILNNNEVKQRCDKVEKGVIWQGFKEFC